MTRLIFRISGNTPFSRDLLTVDVIGVISESMQAFKVDLLSDDHVQLMLYF
jgi:hypothetical protein